VELALPREAVGGLYSMVCGNRGLERYLSTFYQL